MIMITKDDTCGCGRLISVLCGEVCSAVECLSPSDNTPLNLDLSCPSRPSLFIEILSLRNLLRQAGGSDVMIVNLKIICVTKFS